MRGDFEEFVAAAGPRLLRVAWLLTGDAHLAEDLLRTALAKVWPKWARIAGEHPQAYVRKVLVTTHTSWWRRRWRGEVPHGELPERPGPFDVYEGVDLEQSLAVAVRALPARGDLKSPVGVYGLADAGGRLPDRGPTFPYDRGPAFTARGTGFGGASLEGCFDYVIAVNYSRGPGTTPLDWTRPPGAGRGGGIWLHVDPGGPTQGCVSLPKARRRELLRTLEPDRKPVVVMGDAAALGW
ncbi:sigma factor [Streptomyces sp. G5(2025)]|uniref:sigma factor n=1 Tax=Streptomyces sp. G5(2025) TaxID=3406628 RepID=UPI003C198BFF